MIAYVDASALVAVVLREPGMTLVRATWERAERVVSSLLVRPEARAAVARALRTGRMPAAAAIPATAELAARLASITSVAVDGTLADYAAELAEQEALSGCDAVHLATALRLDDPEVVVLTFDRDLAAAARRNGLAVIA